MRRFLLVFLFSFRLFAQNTGADPDLIDIGSRMEMFVDDLLVDLLDNTRFRLCTPERREIVFQTSAAWEGKAASFLRVLEDSGVVRLYYRASMVGKDENRRPVFALAESHDRGLSFTRPNLGLVSFRGSDRNNILAISKVPSIPPPFIDSNPDCAPEHRYKGLSGEWKECYAMSSPDGIHWSLMHPDTLELDGTFDTVNTAFWDARIQAYRSFTRYFENLKKESNEADVLGPRPTVVRAIQSSTSADFIHWAPVHHHEYNDPYSMQMYTNATLPCPGAEHIYLAFPNRYVQERIVDPQHPAPGMNDALFMSSRDCLIWNRIPEAWVRPGLDPLNWTDRNNYAAWGIIKTSEQEWSMYISEHYRHAEHLPRLRRLSIRPNGFVSIHADFQGGEMITKPIRFSGSALVLNYATSAMGTILVEIQDMEGNPIPGYSHADAEPIFGDALNRAVAWANGTDVSSLADQPVRLRFIMQDADIYAIQFIDHYDPADVIGL